MRGVDLAATWAVTVAGIDRAADHFWCTLADRMPTLLPERDAPLFLAALGWLATGDDDRAGRAALLTVLGRAWRDCHLGPHHQALVGDALVATVARHTRPRWTSALAAGWDSAARRALTAVRQAAERVGDGHAWWPVEVLDHDRPAEGVAILTVRPWRRLPFRPGQAVPVSVPGLPGRWRWYSPANAPRADGTIELHVRAAGAVSRVLVERVRPGGRLWLGPPRGAGLTLAPDSSADLLLAAGGTGLAPLRALVEQVAAAPAGRRVTLVSGVRAFADLYDPVSLDKLQVAHDWLTVVPAFSHDAHAEPAERGDALTVALRHHRPGQHVYACGPPAMVAGARLRLRAAGVPAAHIHLPDGCER
ncbi:Phenol hydroxylase P5 protein [Micromonospora sp. MW-13]|uniref:FAD-binding oxidoreductase n=1 Tax=Micromonospora sp. MW-13 TaxID=2094022 RepID=UPI000ECB9508|nr:FAD-binding oxidoreductase [Micromonospora sp. MW-13]RGC69754.1 Phenol hydroxylase P5 protein [Micromonospora sp. MW-13]